jgi:2-C-methyl-D-erythritol 4-phosphate cytidylyltransferase
LRLGTPLITYAFFLLFTAVKVSALIVLVNEQGMTLIEALPQVWDPETQALFAAVMSFWFGQRAVARLRNQ